MKQSIGRVFFILEIGRVVYFLVLVKIRTSEELTSEVVIFFYSIPANDMEGEITSSQRKGKRRNYQLQYVT